MNQARILKTALSSIRYINFRLPANAGTEQEYTIRIETHDLMDWVTSYTEENRHMRIEWQKGLAKVVKGINIYE